MVSLTRRSVTTIAHAGSPGCPQLRRIAPFRGHTGSAARHRTSIGTVRRESAARIVSTVQVHAADNSRRFCCRETLRLLAPHPRSADERATVVPPVERQLNSAARCMIERSLQPDSGQHRLSPQASPSSWRRFFEGRVGTRAEAGSANGSVKARIPERRAARRSGDAPHRSSGQGHAGRRQAQPA